MTEKALLPLNEVHLDQERAWQASDEAPARQLVEKRFILRMLATIDFWHDVANQSTVTASERLVENKQLRAMVEHAGFRDEEGNCKWCGCHRNSNSGHYERICSLIRMGFENA